MKDWVKGTNIQWSIPRFPELETLDPGYYGCEASRGSTTLSLWSTLVVGERGEEAGWIWTMIRFIGLVPSTTPLKLKTTLQMAMMAFLPILNSLVETLACCWAKDIVRAFWPTRGTETCPALSLMRKYESGSLRVC